MKHNSVLLLSVIKLSKIIYKSNAGGNKEVEQFFFARNQVIHSLDIQLVMLLKKKKVNKTLNFPVKNKPSCVNKNFHISCMNK